MHWRQGGRYGVKIWVENPSFWCIIYKVPDPIVLYLQYKGWGKQFMLLSNVVDTKGKGAGGGMPLPRWELF